ncbi:MAG: hypothetical protein LBN29_08240, partial [Mediterranea sp.]|nr:hypothetical protein [Mediterranea sp.]
LMAIHHLDSYLVDSTFCITHEEAQKSPPPYEKMNASRTIFENIANNLRLTVHNTDPKRSDYVDERAAEIREYLDRHPEIIAYVTIDDMYLENGLEGHFVSTDYRLEDEHVRKCVDILNNEDGPYPLNKEEYAGELEAWRKKYVY